MRKIFVLLALCLFLGGCVDVTPPVELTVTTESPSPELYTPEPSAMPSVRPSPSEESYVLNTDFVFDIPESINYAPEVKVFPLTSAFWRYTIGMYGAVTFVDEQLNPIKLPFEPTEYAPITDGSNSVTQGYALGFPRDHSEYDKRYWVLMLADGTVPRGENGEYIFPYCYTNNIDEFTLVGNSIVIYKSISGEYAFDNPSDCRFGLYNLEERREVLPCEYEADFPNDWYFWASDAMFYAIKDGQGLLLDSNGKQLHNFGDVSSVYFRDTGCNWNREERMFLYRDKKRTLIDIRFEYVQICDDVLIAKQNFPSLFIVFDRLGNELYRTDEIEDAKSYAGISEPEVEEWRPMSWSYGIVRPPTQYDETGHYNITTPYGDISIKTDITTSIWMTDNFVLLYEETDPDDFLRIGPKSIYALDGALLLDNVYGWINEVPAPGGRLFVYLDPETCVLLMPDGSTTPVPAAPEVERIQW